MYVVHYVARRDSDEALEKGVSAADTLPDAITRTKARLRTANIDRSKLTRSASSYSTPPGRRCCITNI